MTAFLLGVLIAVLIGAAAIAVGWLVFSLLGLVFKGLLCLIGWADWD